MGQSLFSDLENYMGIVILTLQSVTSVKWNNERERTWYGAGLWKILNRYCFSPS